MASPASETEVCTSWGTRDNAARKSCANKKIAWPMEVTKQDASMQKYAACKNGLKTETTAGKILGENGK